MDRESADRTGRSIDRFSKSEMIVSKEFRLSALKMFGDGYKAIIRNLSREYEKPITEHPAGDTNLAGMTDVERLQLLFEHGVSAYDTKVELAKGIPILTTRHCIHHPGKVCEDRHLRNQSRSCRNSRDRSGPKRDRLDRFGQE